MKSSILLLIFLVVMLQTLSIPVCAQDKNVVDSLESALKVGDDNSHIEALFQLARQFYDVDNPRALQYGQRAFALAEQSGDSSQYVRTSRLTAQLLRRVDNLEKSITMLKKIEPIALRTGQKDEYKKILNALAIAYNFSGDYASALRYNFKSLAVRETEGDKASISIALNNIATVYTELADYRKALQYFRRSLKLKHEIGNTYDLDRLLINIGICLNNQASSDSARMYINEAIRVCGANCTEIIRAEANLGLGGSYLAESKFDTSRQYFLEAYRLAKIANNKRFQIEALLRLVKVNNSLDQFGQNDELLKEAELLTSGTGYNPCLVEIYYELGKWYRKRGDFTRATSYQEKYITLKDSLFNEKLAQNLMVFQSEYEQKENKAKIDSQGRMIVLNQKALQDQIELNVATGTIVVLLATLIGLLYINNRQRKKTNALLQQKIKERTRDLELSYQRLQKIYSEQSHFISKASEDLKFPITTLLGLNSLALKELKQHPAREYLYRMEAVGEQLSNVVDKFKNHGQSRSEIEMVS